MKDLTIKIILGGSLILSTQVQAQDRACDEFGMGVIYKDTLYGLGTGIILTGLTMVAVNRFDHSSQKLAAGGLIGASLGAGVGALEVLTRDCRRTAKSAGWKTPNITYNTLSNQSFGLNFTYVVD